MIKCFTLSSLFYPLLFFSQSISSEKLITYARHQNLNIIEKDLNLEISNYMYDQFRKLGIPVKLTRTTDETVSPTERTQRILDAFGNNNDVIVISNHINSGGGEFTYHYII